MNVAQIIDGIIVREGREYSDRPADRGGPTKFGITIDTLSRWRKRPCTAADVMDLADYEARLIYRDVFVRQPGYQRIVDDTVRAFVVDSAVQHGQGNATKMLQKAAHVFPDGYFGDQTEAAVNRMDAHALFLRFFAERSRFYGALIAHDGELRKATAGGFDRLQALNAAGWANRMADILEEYVLS